MSRIKQDRNFGSREKRGRMKQKQSLSNEMDFPSRSVIKNLLAMQETQEIWVQLLGQEDSLEKEMATHSTLLAWENPMDTGAWWATAHRVARRLQSWTLLNTHIHILTNEHKLGLRACAFYVAMFSCSGGTQSGQIFKNWNFSRKKHREGTYETKGQMLNNAKFVLYNINFKLNNEKIR